jgi:TrmH family RNA methyltransferase
MLSKYKIKLLVSLQKKKVRDELRLFTIEGDKLVSEFLKAGMPVKAIYARSGFLEKLPDNLIKNISDINSVSIDDLKRISTLKTPHNAIAIVHMPDIEQSHESIFKNLCIALDFVQDPGNMGTIVRTAAWFGIKNIVCSADCVDVFNPKVIQSSMGAIIHTNIIYTSLTEFLKSARENGLKIYGTLLEGHSIYDYKLDSKGVILLGNESKGISENLFPYITDKIMIPKAGTSSYGIDSLNVSIAAAIICSEFIKSARHNQEIH